MTSWRRKNQDYLSFYLYRIKNTLRHFMDLASFFELLGIQNYKIKIVKIELKKNKQNFQFILARRDHILQNADLNETLGIAFIHLEIEKKTPINNTLLYHSGYIKKPKRAHKYLIRIFFLSSGVYKRFPKFC